MAKMPYVNFDLKNSPQPTTDLKEKMHTENWDTRMDDQTEDHPDPERLHFKGSALNKYVLNVPTDDVENISDTN